MKRLFLLFVFGVYGCVVIANNEPFRKFPASALLHGLANTCNQLSNAIAAETDKEKQQAALGVIGSIFSLAGNVTNEQEKERQRDKMEVQKRIVDIAIDLLESVKGDSRYKEDIVRLPVLGMVNKVSTRELQSKILQEHITSQLLVGSLIDDMMVLACRIIVNECRGVKQLRFVDDDVDDDNGDDNEVHDKQLEEVDEEVIGLARAIWLFVIELCHKENVTGYLKEQVALLFDFVKESIMTFLNGHVLEGHKDIVEEEVEEAAVS